MMTMNKSIEVLAPCGSFEALTAAVRGGADAVYIGLQRFSARAYADNFGGEELSRAVRYCRLHGVKVHTAVNTLVSDAEFGNALDAARDAYEKGVDAFIVQDWGLAMAIKAACPDAQLHASTQMTVHTPEGARFLYKKGFDRVVLAREMSRREIADVVRSCPVETEVFVHGALCMCVSGQCYLSAMLGGRSGNRGRCAQPCRLPFSVRGGTGHDLSLKDNCVIDNLSELSEMGVSSAKIEGRMKRPEYVFQAVKACRQSLDSGGADTETIDTLRSVFSRSGFTDGYYTENLGRDMFGTRSKEDVTAASGKLLSQIRNEYKNEVQSEPVQMTLTIKAGERAKLCVSSRGMTACAFGGEPQTALSVALSVEKAVSQLGKTGGTPFFADNISAEIGEGLTLPVSEINKMRREALEGLAEIISCPEERRAVRKEIKKPEAHRRSGGLKYRAVFHNCDVPDEFKRCELVFVPLFSKRGDILALKERGFRVGLKVPRVIFGQEERVKAALAEYKDLGITDAYCGNIGTAALAVGLGLNVHGGFSLNVFNTRSLEFIKDSGLCDTEVSFELTSKQINALGGKIKRGVVGYGRLPLMIMRNCPNKNGAGCKGCGGKSELKDRKGVVFEMMCEGGCTELLNADPLMLSYRTGEFGGADFMTLLFTSESADECVTILKMYENGEKPVGRFTRGLYYRGVE